MPEPSSLSQERIAGWLASVNDASLRALDEQLLVELIVLEQNTERQHQVVALAANYLETADAAAVSSFEQKCAECGVPSDVVHSLCAGERSRRDGAPKNTDRHPRSAERKPPVRTIRNPRMNYARAVSAAEASWAAAIEGSLHLPSALAAVEDLAQMVISDRAEAIALASSDEFENFTFTHMVNVAILTMAQAVTLGIEGRLLRDVGLAAFLHDIGKVRTPADILHKPERLTPEEFQIIQRHTIDGAVLLRATSSMPSLVPVVALEHHLRLDGSGYPSGVKREQLNVATLMCSIADVYDAMRSQRSYQEPYTSDRIFAVLQRGDRPQFDPALVERFAELLGCHPSGTLAAY